MKPFMNSPGMWTSAIAASTLLVAFSTISFAQTGGQSTDSDHIHVENVEELLDNISRYDNKEVQVCGEVDEVGNNAFVLESGGVFNDEIVVIIPKGKEGDVQIEDDSDVTVTGTVRTVAIVDIEREYGIDLDPEIEVEMEGVKAFLVADKIENADKC